MKLGNYACFFCNFLMNKFIKLFVFIFQLLLPQPSENIECSNQMEQNHSLIPISNRFHQVPT